MAYARKFVVYKSLIATKRANPVSPYAEVITMPFAGTDAYASGVDPMNRETKNEVSHLRKSTSHPHDLKNPVPSANSSGNPQFFNAVNIPLVPLGESKSKQVHTISPQDMASLKQHVRTAFDKYLQYLNGKKKKLTFLISGNSDNKHYLHAQQFGNNFLSYTNYEESLTCLHNYIDNPKTKKTGNSFLAFLKEEIMQDDVHHEAFSDIIALLTPLKGRDGAKVSKNTP